MSGRIDHSKHRHRGMETADDSAIERAFTQPSKPRPAWSRAADRKKAQKAAALIAAGKVNVTKCPPAAPKGCVSAASPGLSEEMAAKVAAVEAEIAADRKARETGRGT